MILSIFLQINPWVRPKVYDSDEFLKFLESFAAKIQTDPKIEAEWQSFHSLIKVPAEFKVDERTLSSRDLFKELTKISLKAKSSQMATGGT